MTGDRHTSWLDSPCERGHAAQGGGERALPARGLLTINAGSSSLKAALYPADVDGTRALTLTVERIGAARSPLRISDGSGTTRHAADAPLPDHAAAAEAWFDWLRQAGYAQTLVGIGHRVVHGGARYAAPARITSGLRTNLRDLVALDPLHLPQALAVIETAGRAFPDVPQVACFDTAFHRQMPRVAQLFALPRRILDAGVQRYGFHGLSYEYIMAELRRVDPVEAAGRVIIAHLGNGASMAAVRDGVSIDTTMGFSPTGGLVMGTRSGDLDPGVLLYLLQYDDLSSAALNQLVNREAGLLGVSGSSADMRDLLQLEASDARAAEAIALFCYQARKFIAALAAALGGLDTLVFTAGIGEQAAPVRQRICAELAFLGIQLDSARNDAHAPVISRDTSPVTVRVIPTDEDLMIARHTRQFISHGGTNHAGGSELPL
jgi:acetate kinase